VPREKGPDESLGPFSLVLSPHRAESPSGASLFTGRINRGVILDVRLLAPVVVRYFCPFTESQL